MVSKVSMTSSDICRRLVIVGRSESPISTKGVVPSRPGLHRRGVIAGRARLQSCRKPPSPRRLDHTPVILRRAFFARRRTPCPHVALPAPKGNSATAAWPGFRSRRTVWLIQAVFWLEWDSSTAAGCPMSRRFCETWYSTAPSLSGFSASATGKATAFKSPP
jgi:hypothetical protein